jgi:hypothetical protein
MSRFRGITARFAPPASAGMTAHVKFLSSLNLNLYLLLFLPVLPERSSHRFYHRPDVEFFSLQKLFRIA